MSRRSRRLHVRLVRAAAVAASAAFLYRRWQLRAFGVYPASAYHSPSPSSAPTSAPEEAAQPLSTTRRSRWSRLLSSSPDKPFDVLVVGGGLIGLYTAVDAAQRGLHVALIDAADIGSGSTTSHMPAVSPGAFPYVQRAIRQRDAGWLRAAVTTMAEETTWQNVAASCVLAPDTVRQRVQTRLARVRRYFGRSREVAANGGSDGGVSVRTATTLLPALHSLEMFEYVCAAVISTALSVFCGPMRPVSVLSTAAVERRLPALGSNAACPSRSPAVRVKGGVVTSNTSIATHTAAVALALTAEQLGVALCTYAPIVHLREQTATENNVPNGKRGSSAQEVQAGHGLTSWLVGPSVERTSAAGPSTIFVAHVRDALSAGSEVDRSGSRTPASASTPFLLRWLAPRTVITASSTTTPALVAHTQKGHAYEAAAVSTASSAAAVVYARSVVNCTGCDVDAVKTLFDGNARDAVPAAFAGYLTYSYLVAPADAVYAAPAAAQPEDHSHSTDATKAALTSPLSQSTRTTGLHFSSPRLSFASAMVLPWWDRCVLLGPSISPLPLLRRSENAVAAAGAAPDAFPQRGHGDSASALEGSYVVQSVDGYAAQRERVVTMLASCGVAVDASRLLSCVSQVVPYVKSPKEVPFQRELLDKGYALRFSSVPVQERDDAPTPEAVRPSPTPSEISRHDEEKRHRDVALLHVYGGSPVLARRIAEDAVNALVRHPALVAAAREQQLHRCRTHRLLLTTPPSLAKEAALPDEKAESRLEALILDTYAERLVDVVARRTHVAYTSPDDAMRALPSIAAVMRRLKGWSAEQMEAEVDAARRLVASIAVVAPTAAS